MTRGTVLLVESQDETRNMIGYWLEEAGYEVLLCPGPGEPDYVCLGGRGLACPLAEPADVVVLGMQLRSDDMQQGTPGWLLLAFYVEQGKQVIAITSERDPVHPLPDDQVTVLTHPVDRNEILDALWVRPRR